MKFKGSIILAVVLAFAISSCKTDNSEVIWVSGYKQLDLSEEDPNEFMTVSKSADLAEQNWERLDSEIEGLSFQEGYLQKIKVSKNEETSNYVFVKELEKTEDGRLALDGGWILESLNGEAIGEGVSVPTINFNLYNNTVYGSGGCNTFSSTIERVTTDGLKIGNAAATLMACAHDNVEDAYFQSLYLIDAYKVEDTYLVFFNAEGEEILKFSKDKMDSRKKELAGEWILNEILGEDIIDSEITPSITFDFSKMSVYGMDGCNNYFGPIENLDENTLELGVLASTKKMCIDMKIADDYSKTLNEVKGYKIEGDELILLNVDGEEILIFNRV